MPAGLDPLKERGRSQCGRPSDGLEHRRVVGHSGSAHVEDHAERRAVDLHVDRTETITREIEEISRREGNGIRLMSVPGVGPLSRQR